MNKDSFLLIGNQSRIECKRAIDEAPRGCVVTIKVSRSDEQNARFHAMLGDIAKQCKHVNQSWDTEGWKRLCVDMFRKETMDDPRLGEYWRRNGVRFIPSLDGSGIVALGEQTRRFPMYVATAFIEWLYAWADERDVIWSDPTQPPVEAYDEDARRAA